MKYLPRRLAEFSRTERGGVAVIAALTLPVLIGLSALAVDVGYYRYVDNRLQTAADAAALAAALELGSPTTATNKAVDFASRNVPENYGTVTTPEDVQFGFWEAATRTFAPASGTDVNAVRVTAERSPPRGNAPQRFFGRIFGPGATTISASAVAARRAGGTGCVLALSETATPGILVTGSSGSTLTLCDMVSNASGVGFEMSGMGASVSAQCIQTAGTAVVTDNLTVSCAALREHAGIVRDPFADVEEPALEGPCNSGSVGQNNQTTNVTPTSVHSSGMPSRRYCNGLDVRGTVHFAPGLYLVEGGEFRVNSNAVLNGDGVVFYLAPGVEFRFNGTATIDFSAPTSGEYAGIIIFSSRASTVSHLINGNLGSRLDGAIYAQNSHFTLSGNASTSANSCTQIVTGTVEFTGNGEIDINCENPSGANIDLAGRVALVQ